MTPLGLGLLAGLVFLWIVRNGDEAEADDGLPVRHFVKTRSTQPRATMARPLKPVERAKSGLCPLGSIDVADRADGSSGVYLDGRLVGRALTDTSRELVGSP